MAATREATVAHMSNSTQNAMLMLYNPYCSLRNSHVNMGSRGSVVQVCGKESRWRLGTVSIITHSDFQIELLGKRTASVLDNGLIWSWVLCNVTVTWWQRRRGKRQRRGLFRCVCSPHFYGSWYVVRLSFRSSALYLIAFHFFANCFFCHRLFFRDCFTKGTYSWQQSQSTTAHVQYSQR